MPDAELEILQLGGVSYRLRPLNALEQYRLMKAILPGLQAIGAATVPALALTAMGTDEAKRFFSSCVGALQVQDESGGWVRPASTPDLAHMVTLSTALALKHFGVLWAMPRPDVPRSPTRRPLTAPVVMPAGEEWLFRPVLRGMCRAESLLDGTLKIEDVALFNDVLDCLDETEARELKALEDRRRG